MQIPLVWHSYNLAYSYAIPIVQNEEMSYAASGSLTGDRSGAGRQTSACRKIHIDRNTGICMSMYTYIHMDSLHHIFHVYITSICISVYACILTSIRCGLPAQKCINGLNIWPWQQSCFGYPPSVQIRHFDSNFIRIAVVIVFPF